MAEAFDSKDVKLFGYTVLGILDSGSSSTTYDVGNGEALKIPENKNYLTGGHTNLVELTVMCGMEHPNILSGKLCISSSGGIGILMRKIDKIIIDDLSYIERLSAIYQIGMALLFLYDNGFGHFDIEVSNILYDTKSAKAYLSGPIESLGRESDVWSFAMIMLHILGGEKFKDQEAFLADNLTEERFDAFILSLLPTEIHNIPLTTFVIILLRRVFLSPRKDRPTLYSFLSDPLFALYRTRECYEFGHIVERKLPPLSLSIPYALSIPQCGSFPETIPLLSAGKIKSVVCPVHSRTPYPMQELIRLAVVVYGTRKIPISFLFLGIDIAYRTFDLCVSLDASHIHAVACLFIASKYITGFPIDVKEVIPSNFPITDMSVILMENKIIDMLGGIIYRPYFYSIIENIWQVRAVLELIVPYPDKYCDLNSLNAIVMPGSLSNLQPKESLYMSDIDIAKIEA